MICGFLILFLHFIRFDLNNKVVFKEVYGKRFIYQYLIILIVVLIILFSLDNFK